jgi:predicted phage terminase large subunit-like protein
VSDLTFTRGDATWTALRTKAMSSLYFFAGVVLKLGDAVGMTESMHGLMTRVVEKRTGVPRLDTAPYRMILMPRGTGKSALITQAYTLQRLCADQNLAVLIANERLENAVAFLAAIKQQVEQNELLQSLFPEIVPANYNETTWSTTKILLPRTSGRQEPSILCIGSGGTVTGMHPDLIIADDIISREAMENARRGDGNLTDQMVRWLAQLVPLLNSGYEPFPEILLAGTRWYRGDVYERAEELWGAGQSQETWMLSVKTPTGTSEPIPVHRTGDVVTFSRKAVENGRATWPERKGYDVESLAKLRLMDAELYAANYQNDPSDDLTSTFKESWVQYYDWSTPDVAVQYIDGAAKTVTHLLADLDILMLIDPGGFAIRKGNDRMRGAILVTGTTPGDTPEHLILDTFSDAVPFMQVADQILALTTRYRPRKVYIEEVAQQAAFLELVRRLATERGVSLPLERITPRSKVKEARILNLEPYFQRGLIRLGRGPQFHELREQYRAFPRGTRVDLLDALAYGPQVWRQPRMGGVSQAARQRVEVERYKQRRGFSARS